MRSIIIRISALCALASCSSSTTGVTQDLAPAHDTQIDHILRSLPDYSPGKYQVTLNNKRGGGDSFCLFIEGNDPGSAEKVKITERMKQILLIKPDSINFGERLPIGGKVIDKR